MVRPPMRPYPGRVAETARMPAAGEPEPWDEDPRLTAHLGARGAEAFRAMFDAFPEAVGLVWAIRDDAAGSSTSTSATATRRSCTCSACPAPRRAATPCSRR